MEQKEIERPMSMTEAAAFTGLKTSYLYRLVHEKRIPYYKPMGGRVFFKQSDLAAFMFRGRQSADYEQEAEAERFINGGLREAQQRAAASKKHLREATGGSGV
jgi:excisionase family DNA binding protein